MKNILPLTQKCLKLLFSKKYRYKRRLKNGEKLWNEVNNALPEAVGCAFDDDERLEKFRQRVLMMPSGDQQTLKLWLTRKLQKLEKNKFDELASVKDEARQARTVQIYREHLEAIP